jgi:hypothetical protein
MGHGSGKKLRDAIFDITQTDQMLSILLDLGYMTGMAWHSVPWKYIQCQTNHL